ncbi:hypothetical protein U8335_13840 [Roseiconus lacunae]|uniref:hypothetical protein n=1 Tax=Roseiconus lacunae TaxID=2605694 RepID=UPI00308D30A6|nr:hypothetical protein U8335_13840 [Stieleria sp. HD01]
MPDCCKTGHVESDFELQPTGTEAGTMELAFPIQSEEFRGAKFIHSRESSVTTAWGVDWSDSMIARDLMQNFYDAHLDNIDNINVVAAGSNVTVSGTEGFDLNELFYLASEKTEKHVGQYGEGFKAAIACLLRRHPDAVVIASSGKESVSVRLSTETLGDSAIQPLVYDFFSTKRRIAGSQLVIQKVSTDLVSEIGSALSQFWHLDNPLVGELIAKSSDGKLSVFRSTSSNGHLFYRGLKRAEIPDLPLLLVCEKAYQQIERKIAHDRDRKAFDEAVVATLYSVWANNFFRHDQRAICAVIDAARPLWEQGKPHPLLAAIASKRPRFGTTLSGRFDERYFAVCKSSDREEQLRFSRKEDQWKQEGKVALPKYFSSFGVQTAQSFFEKQLKLAEEEAERRGRRSLSPAETKAKEVLEDAIQEFAPELWDSFGRRRPRYSIAETETLLGQFKKALPYRTSDVFLAASVFEADLADALAVFLHEHAHIYGYDGSREFTDALTWLIASVIRNRTSLDKLDSRWVTARHQVSKERKSKTLRPNDKLSKQVDSLSETQVRQLIQMLPPRDVMRLIKKFDHPTEST